MVQIGSSIVVAACFGHLGSEVTYLDLHLATQRYSLNFRSQLLATKLKQRNPSVLICTRAADYSDSILQFCSILFTDEDRASSTQISNDTCAYFEMSGSNREFRAIANESHAEDPMTSSNRVQAHGNIKTRRQGTQACRYCRRRKVKVPLPFTLHRSVVAYGRPQCDEARPTCSFMWEKGT
jgi:hypothetical protein